MDQQTLPSERPLDDPLLHAAHARFGVEYLFPYQRLVIANTLESSEPLERQDTRQLVILPTGAGKSLCFQLPAALLDGCTVVVYPLLSLMADQARRLEATGLSYATLSGQTSRDDRRTILNTIAAGVVRILLTNPETLTAPETVTALSRCAVDHLVVDEAHCVCEWGETFRPAYLAVGPAVAQIKPRVLTAFTATASPYVLTSINRHLFLDQPVHLVSANPDRPNIHYQVIPAIGGIGALRELLIPGDSGPSFLGRVPPSLPVERPAIVFCRSRAATELTAGRLRRLTGDNEIRFYHAGLSSGEKGRVEKWFFAADHGVLIATCAYGLGIDKSNIRTVIHPEPAPTVEAFLQESGRAGRDGKPAVSITLSPPIQPGILLIQPTLPVVASETTRGRGADGADLLLARQRAMSEYLVHDGCRRSFLLERMGAEAVGCTGCDHCDGRAAGPIPAMRILHRAARCHRRTIDRGSLSRLLCGHPTGQDRRTRVLSSRYIGALRPRSAEECTEAVAAALQARVIRIRRRPFWPGTIDVGNRLP
ncbi:MAG: ATP-dependent DNA helicase RecQ [Spirochaetaceae bacterium]|nr:MAG: ATP-dependent DNA helicase RecQ [Spirochaetaceae bacterium]